MQRFFIFSHLKKKLKKEKCKKRKRDKNNYALGLDSRMNGYIVGLDCEVGGLREICFVSFSWCRPL